MTIPLALIWHQHQPYYKDLASGEMVMPWVRLHGIKDYYGMARLLYEFPAVQCTINLVPSMLTQLQDYVEKGATDPVLKRTQIPAEALSGEDACCILDQFFMAQWDRMVRPYPRYAQLLEMRRCGRRPAAAALEDFNVQDLRDLQVWFNLVWFHPVSFEESETLRELRAKGRDFSEQDKAALLREQKQVLARVIPLHRELAARNQVELTTTPFYHPLLPLLCDMRCAQVAMPRTPMPSGYVSLAADGAAQLEKAIAYHETLFGAPPKGLWPAEGGVSPQIVPLLAQHGIQWMATDEGILSASLGAPLRDSAGKLEHPELLYRAWRYEHQGAGVNILFRDNHLSDLIGFQYQSWDGAAAANDFVLQLQAAVSKERLPADALVSVILDGENCWEHYPDQGLVFLRTLYARLADPHQDVQPVRVSEFLAAHPPRHRLDQLFPGSWINRDFYIWIGHAEDRRAWEYLFRAREDLVAATGAHGVKSHEDTALARAWDELYIAEGSDWYWWYGDDHNSGNDLAFDNLFRLHLKNVYQFIGQAPPPFLSIPLKGGGPAGRYTSPTVSLRVTLDGRVTSYFEWLGAGGYRADKEGGVMAAASAALVDQIYFGYDQDNLLVRIDLREEAPAVRAARGKGAERRRAVEQLVLRFPDLKGLALRINSNDEKAPQFDGPWATPAKAPRAEVAWEEIVEIRVAFEALGVHPGDELSFFVDVTARGRSSERYPRSCSVQLTVPPRDLYDYEWMV